MASLLSGLGQGIGAAAGGYLVGQNKGEAEAYRRQQSSLAAEYRKQALAAQTAARQAAVKDPNDEKRKFYQGIAADMIKRRNDPEMHGFFSDTANAGYTRGYDEATQHAMGRSRLTRLTRRS